MSDVLTRFPCGFDQDDIEGDPKPCGGDCACVEFDRPCPFLLIYKKALAYKRCARLLKVFAGRWLDVVSRAYLAVSDPSFRNWTNLSHLTGSIHKALRDAGL